MPSARRRRIYLVRHGQTEWNREKRLQGSRNSPLTELGRAQASRSAAILEDDPPSALLSSPLGRARETATALTEAYGLVAKVDPRLAEIRMGEAEGLTLDEVEAALPGFLAERERDKWHRRWPSGECYQDVAARLRRFIAEVLEPLLAVHNQAPVAIVGHETMNMILLGELIALPEAMTLRCGQPNGVVYRLTDEGVEHADAVPAEWRPGVVEKRSGRILKLETA
jgi:broad specificity phosphatase PhoE